MKYKEVYRVKVEDGDQVLFDNRGREVIIMRLEAEPEPVEVDVTAECTAELRKSKSSNGHYVGICHKGKVIFALGVDDKSKFIPFIAGSGYRIEPVPDATVSFRVTRIPRKVRHGLY